MKQRTTQPLQAFKKLDIQSLLNAIAGVIVLYPSALSG